MKYRTYRVKNTALFLPILLALGISSAQAAPDCSAMTQPIYQAVNPNTGSNLLTPWEHEAKSASQYGFTDYRGPIFYASLQTGQELMATARLYHSALNVFFWTSNPTERDSAVNKYGYSISKLVDFYASRSQSATCTQQVYRLVKGAAHYYTADTAERSRLLASGSWIDEGIAFYGKPLTTPPVTNSVFSIAVLPDTQNEAQPCGSSADVASYDPAKYFETCRPGMARQNPNDWRLKERMQWLASNKNQLNLRYVAHSGDLVNWGERDEPQYKLAADAYQVLSAAGIPFTIAAGNHDTQAVCAGGSACQYAGYKAWVEVRKTPRFNQYMGSLMKPYIAGQFQPGDYTNTYSFFDGGGLKWMVLTLELWPRVEVINWAKTVVAGQPNRNVIVVTHSYLDGNSNIIASKDGNYGKTTPKELYNGLISLYPNIRFVFSGHVGAGGYRTDVGRNGNKIVSFLQAFHSNNTNPTRIVEINAQNNSVRSYVYAPKTNENIGSEVNQSGMNFIR